MVCPMQRLKVNRYRYECYREAWRLLRPNPEQKKARGFMTAAGGWPILNFAFFAKFRVGMFTCHRLSPANKLDCPHALGTTRFSAQWAGGPPFARGGHLCAFLQRVGLPECEPLGY